MVLISGFPCQASWGPSCSLAPSANANMFFDPSTDSSVKGSRPSLVQKKTSKAVLGAGLGAPNLKLGWRLACLLTMAWEEGTRDELCGLCPRRGNLTIFPTLLGL